MKNNNLPKKTDQKLNEREKIIQKGKETVEGFNELISTTNNTIGQVKNLTDSVNNIAGNFLESQKIQSETRLGLKKIEENHKTINKHIDTEYKKQSQTLNKAEDAIDKGLESDNIDLVKAGLETMSGVANHNPMVDLKNHLDSQVNKNFNDDDFIIEI